MLRILTTILLPVYIVLLCSCNKGRIISPLNPPDPINTPTPGPTNPTALGKTWLALGDSYTIGESVSVGEGYPGQTKEWLQQNGLSMVQPRIIAGTGWTTYVLQNQIGNQNVGHSYDAVTLLIGVNDQYIGRTMPEYELNFTQLLEWAIFFADSKPSHVFVLSIPDYSVTPFAVHADTARIRREIDQFNAINKRVTLAHSAQYLDITPSTREAKDDLSLLAADGLHPSGKEYGKWTSVLGPMMKAALQ